MTPQPPPWFDRMDDCSSSGVRRRAGRRCTITVPRTRGPQARSCPFHASCTRRACCMMGVCWWSGARTAPITWRARSSTVPQPRSAWHVSTMANASAANASMRSAVIPNAVVETQATAVPAAWHSEPHRTENVRSSRAAMSAGRARVTRATPARLATARARCAPPMLSLGAERCAGSGDVCDPAETVPWRRGSVPS